jgi:hypothetical protein
MNIEDLIISLVYSRITLNSWDEKLTHSFYDQLTRGLGFTEKQSSLAIKMLTRHTAALSVYVKTDISEFVKNPTFRIPIRRINNVRSLSVVTHSQIGRAIKAVFPYNEDIIKQIRLAKDDVGVSFWDKDEKAWFFALNESSLQFLMELSCAEKFETDEYITNFFQQVQDVKENFEKFVPMLVIEEKLPKIKNCSASMPELITTDILESIFEARKRGIFTWDETVSNFLDSDEVDPITREFLKSDTSQNLQIDCNIHDISVIKHIIEFMSPTLVIVPGGNEFETLKNSYDFFKSLNIENTQMSVMFRLPSETHENFNIFIKQHELNSPICEKTKVVFISGKMPKPVLQSKIKFHSVLNLGYSNVHYSMREIVGSHENVVSYSKVKESRNLQFGFM